MIYRCDQLSLKDPVKLNKTIATGVTKRINNKNGVVCQNVKFNDLI